MAIYILWRNTFIRISGLAQGHFQKDQEKRQNVDHCRLNHFGFYDIICIHFSSFAQIHYAVFFLDRYCPGLCQDHFHGFQTGVWLKKRKQIDLKRLPGINYRIAFNITSFKLIPGLTNLFVTK